MQTKLQFRLIFILVILNSILSPKSTIHAQDTKQVGLPENAIARLGKGGIHEMQFSPDGSKLAVGTTIGVWLYDVDTRQAELLNATQYEDISTLAFSPNGKILASGGFTNHVIQLWDLEAKNEPTCRTLNDRFAEISQVVFAEDNKTLYCLSKYGYYSIWDIETEKEISAKSFSEIYITAAFSKHGKIFVIGDTDNNIIRLWDSNKGSLGDIFKEKSDLTPEKKLSKLFNNKPKEDNVNTGIQALTFSTDGRLIASANKNNIIQLWDTDKKLELYKLNGHKELINTLAFSPDNKILASGSADRTIKLWNVNDGILHKTLNGHQNSISTLTFSPKDNGLLASASTDGTIRFWNTNTGNELKIFDTGYIETVKALAFSKNDAMLCSAAFNGTVTIWNVKTGKKLPPPTLPNFDRVNAPTFSQDATLYIYNGIETDVSADGERLKPEPITHMWILPVGEKLISFPQKMTTIALSPNNNILASVTPNVGIGDTKVEWWDTTTGVKIFSTNIDLFFSENLKFSPDGKYIALYGSNVQTRMWDIETQIEFSFPDYQEVLSLAFSPDSTTLAINNANVITFWNITPSGLQIEENITSLKNDRLQNIMLFSPDGKSILEVIHEPPSDIIKIRNIGTGKVIESLSGHTKWIETIIFSHDGKILATGAADGIILLWNWEKIIAKNTEDN